MIIKISPIIAVASLVMLSACSEGSFEYAINEPPRNLIPTAVINANSLIDERSSVLLDGTASTDGDGSIAAYNWTVTGIAPLIMASADSQVDSLAIADPLVSFSDSTSATPSLSVGEVIVDTDITLLLKVTDDTGGSAEQTHTIRVRELDFTQLPPSPGSAKLDTLDGVDSNSNGIRDDIEISIYQLYRTDPGSRQILNMGAKALQANINAGTSNASSDNNTAAQALAKFSYCLSEHSSLDGGKTLATLHSLTINNPLRQNAYDAYKRSRHGSVQNIAVMNANQCLAGL